MKKLAVVLAMWFAPVPALAANPASCTFQVGEISAVAKTYLDALRADAFADAFAPYIADLERVEADTRSWLSEVREYVRTPCRTYSDAVEIYNRDKLEWDRTVCALGPIPQDMAADCRYRHSQLTMRHTILSNREREIRAIDAGFQRRAEAINMKTEQAAGRAAAVLGPDHDEDALRLYISWMKRSSGAGSCHSLSRITEQLGQRVTDQWKFLELLARNLVTSPQRLRNLIRVPTLSPFSFDSSGFKARFRTETADNQVRHAVAYMVVGYKYRGSGADLVAQFRDELKGEPQDYWLGVEAGHMGFLLRNGTYDTRNFGRAVGASLCE